LSASLNRIPVTPEHLESWPGLSRPSTSLLQNRRKQDMDARDERRHDAETTRSKSRLVGRFSQAEGIRASNGPELSTSL
jgi:hypothetical protein